MSNTIGIEEWEHWYSRVYGYFYKRINGKYEVEELTAQTLNTCFLATNVRNFKAYVWKVAHNYLVSYINTKNLDPINVSWDESIDLKNSSLPSWEMEIEVETKISSNYQTKLNELLDCIRGHIKNPQDQQILELAIYQEKNSPEISKVVGLTAENVRQRLSRNLNKMRTKCIDLWKTLNLTK